LKSNGDRVACDTAASKMTYYGVSDQSSILSRVQN